MPGRRSSRRTVPHLAGVLGSFVPGSCSLNVIPAHPLVLPSATVLTPVDLNVQLVETDRLHVWLDSFRTWADGTAFFLHLRRPIPDGDSPSLEIRMEDGKVVWPNFWLGVIFADGRGDEDRMSDISMAPAPDDVWLRSLGCGGTGEHLDGGSPNPRSTDWSPQLDVQLAG